MAKALRGFALMSKARRREIATMGGIAVQRAGTGHKYTKREAAEAGRIGQRTIVRNRAAAAAARKADEEENPTESLQQRVERVRRSRMGS